MLIRKDKEFAHDASIIQTLVSEGYVTGELKKVSCHQYHQSRQLCEPALLFRYAHH